MIPALFTGSRVYGKPSKKSDVDLVLLVTQRKMAELVKLADKVDDFARKKTTDSDGNREISGASVRFGTLNLILTTDPEQFAVWELGTLSLYAKRPVSRKAAIARFRKLRKNYVANYSPPKAETEV